MDTILDIDWEEKLSKNPFPEHIDAFPCDLCGSYFVLDYMETRKVGNRNMLLCKQHSKIFDDAVNEVCIPV